MQLNTICNLNDMPNTLPSITALFPDSVLTEELWTHSQVRIPCELIYPEEEALIAHAVPKRQNEFRLGRYCARSALRRLSVPDTPILASSDRVPIWPDGTTGSITHTDGYCGAAIARTGRFISLGLDVERIGNIDPDVWRLVCSSDELDWISNMPPQERNQWSYLIFSAKEAAYKCWYPICRKWLSFHDVDIHFGSSGIFTAVLTDDACTRHSELPALSGTYLLDTAWVLTGVTWEIDSQESELDTV